MLIKNKILKVLAALFLLLSITFSFDYYLYLKVYGQFGGTFDIKGAYLCQDINNCQQSTPISFKVYDYNTVKNCFNEYNINNIDSCVAPGEISPENIQLNSNNEKELVLKVSTPDKKEKGIYFWIYYDENYLPYYGHYTFTDLSEYNINYYNIPYYVIHGLVSPDKYLLLLKPVDENGRKVVEIQQFSVSNEVEIHLPLLINIPVKVDSQLCNKLQFIDTFYIPDSLKSLVKIPINVDLKIYHNNNVVFEDHKVVYQSVSACSNTKVVSFSWTPQETGEHIIKLSAEVDDKTVINDIPDVVEETTTVYDSSQQFCYSNVLDFTVTNETGGQIFYAYKPIKVSFKLLSGQNDGTGSFTPINSLWQIYVDGNLKATGVVTLNSLSYVDITKILSGLSVGNHQIKLVVKAATCPYDNNKEVVVTKNVQVLEAPLNNVSNENDNENSSNENNENNQSELNNNETIQTCNPVISFNVEPLTGNAPLNVNYTAEVSNLSNCNYLIKAEFDYNNDGIVDYANYQYNNGQNSVVFNSKYVFTNPGNYSSILKIEVYDGNQLIKESSQTYSIVVNQPEEQQCSVPEVSSSVNPTSGQAPLAVNFTLTFNNPSNCSYVAFVSYDFDGDGNADFIKEVKIKNNTNLEVTKNYTYENEGTYNSKIKISIYDLEEQEVYNYTFTNVIIVNLNNLSNQTNNNYEQTQEIIDLIDDNVETEEFSEPEETGETVNNNENVNYLELYQSEIEDTFEEPSILPKEEVKTKKETISLSVEKDESKVINLNNPALLLTIGLSIIAAILLLALFLI